MQRGHGVLDRQIRQEPVLDHLQHDRGGPDLQERGDLAHVRVADDHVEPPVLLRVGVRLVARVDDGALERGLQTDLGLEEVRALRQLVGRAPPFLPRSLGAHLPRPAEHLTAHEERGQVADDVAERRRAIDQIVLVRTVGIALAVAVVLVDRQARARRELARHLRQRTLQHALPRLVVHDQIAWRDALRRGVLGVRVIHVVARAVREDDVGESQVLVAAFSRRHGLEPPSVAQRGLLLVVPPDPSQRTGIRGDQDG